MKLSQFRIRNGGNVFTKNKSKQPIFTDSEHNEDPSESNIPYEDK